MTRHQCPWCRCDDPEWDPGTIDTSAEFYPLVMAVDALTGRLMELGAGRGKRFETDTMDGCEPPSPSP